MVWGFLFIGRMGGNKKKMGEAKLNNQELGGGNSYKEL